MHENKTFFIVMLAAVMLMFAISCQISGTPVIFESAVQAGGTSGTDDSTGLILTFSADPATLTADDITLTGATKGALSGSGTTRTLAISDITVADGETVSIAISNPSGYEISGSPQTAVVYKDAIPTSGRLARYRFENNGVDEQGSYTLSNITGSPAFSTSSAPEGSYFLSLDESSDLYSSSNMAISTGKVSISMWVYLDSTHSAGGNLSPFFFAIKFGLVFNDPASELRAQVDTTNCATALSTDTWTHIIMTYDGSNVILYKDGSQVSNAAVSYDISGSANIRIGSLSGGDFWKGGMDDVILYNRALSSSEVSALYSFY